MRSSSRARIIAGILIAVSRFDFIAEAGDPERVKNQTPSQALSRDAVLRALRQSADFYWKKVSTEGGYHFHYAEDLSYGRSEHGDGLTQVEVQREATPIVGLAYLRAYEATGDRFYLDAARAAAHALVKGQLCSGGWDYLIEFDPAKRPRYRYRNDQSCAAAREEGPPTTLDDNVTQGALRLLMRVDLALDFADKGGGFILLAQMPEPQPAWAQQYDLDMHPAWARIFEPPSVTGGESQGILKTLFVLYRETGDRKYLEPIPRALDYLRRSVLPASISGVARPSEARARISRGAPVLARFYELKTNKPLYITKGTRVTVPGKPVTLLGGYELSYSDESVIRHYGVLTSGAGLGRIAAEYQRLAKADPNSIKRPLKLQGLSPWSDDEAANATAPNLASRVGRVIHQLDARGAWVEEGSIGKSGQVVSVFAAKEMGVKIGDRVLPLKENETLEVFEGADRPRERIVRSATFARNVETLCAWLAAAHK